MNAEREYTASLRNFWFRPTLEGARDELVVVPPQPQVWNDQYQDQELAQFLGALPELGELNTAIDYGCGIGRAVRALARRGVRVHAVDVSPQMLEHCRAYVGDYWHLVTPHLSDGWGCPDVPDGSCDLALSFFCVQHMPTREMQQATINELFRVLKPRGHLLLQTSDNFCDQPPEEVGMVGPRIVPQKAVEMVVDAGFYFLWQNTQPVGVDGMISVLAAQRPCSS